ncbi:sugar kinase [Novosphingobium sp. 1949]|uniref:Sugar kinase n=1 Tax=Novosphingobium organovorum TaxID=2930092 RepID=A0ABT0BD20_9SPHN|nr:sugar kinase [Novosphingobium organovorum]MCJ2182888.1 sugar kinase [Novosphingobium organovorum]
MVNIVCLGEAMLELSGAGESWRMGIGGDTVNTAVHLSRAGHRVSYMTAVGACAFSARLREGWEREGVNSTLVLENPAASPGLYAISTDERGERSFTYWRERSAATRLFETPGIAPIVERAQDCDLFYFSLISVAILSDAGRQGLLDLAAGVRRKGGRVAFDSNYRPQLWSSQDEAIAFRDRCIALADFGFPTFEDESTLERAGSPQEVVQKWQDRGCGEVVVKLGADGCLLPDLSVIPPAQVLVPVDTSGAGDAFNAGYLAQRLNGGTPRSSAVSGNALAAWCVMRRGAVPARES